MHTRPTTDWTSERTLRFTWPEAGDDFLERAAAWCARLRTDLAPTVTDATAGLRTVALRVDPLTADRAAIERSALKIVASTDHATDSQTRSIEIPVCFDEDLAPDLALLPDNAVELLTRATFRPALFGFAPGFAYLAGLPDALRTPRLATPRPRVPAGSVAIADRFAAIYPGPTPGGWNLVGRTPLTMFDHTRDEPALLRAGDRVRFLPITRADFDGWRP